MARLSLVYVPTDMAHAIWPLVDTFILNAVHRGVGSHSVIRDMVLGGRAMLWMAQDGKVIHAVAVSLLVFDQTHKVCEIVACGGKGMREWLPLLKGMERYAKGEGCTSMRLIGRKGWQRMLKDYSPRHVILEKALT